MRKTPRPPIAGELLYLFDKDLTIELRRRRSELYFIHAAVVSRVETALVLAASSGSGKSTVARNVAEHLTTSSVAFIDMDAYYKNFTSLSLDERRKLNWDHPDAFDYDLLCSHLNALSQREAIEKPEYDFVTHLRRAEPTRVEPAMSSSRRHFLS